MRKALIFALAASLSACTTLQPPPAPPPAPLNSTVIDEKGLIIALSAYEAVLTAVDGLVAAKVLVPGTDKALSVQRNLILARDALQAASAAQRAGSSATYAEALANAGVAFRAIQGLLKR